MKSAIILTGSDRYASKWHDHAATSQRVAEILREIGFDARLRGTHPRVFDQLAGADLVVVDAGKGTPGPDDAPQADWDAAHEKLRAHVAGGGALLALHNSPSAFDDLPEWTTWLGGAWVNGTTMHPPIADSRVKINTGAHPIVDGMDDFDVYDEMYSYMVLEPGNTILAAHTYEGLDHPLAWARVTAGGGRVVFDALGHGVESYASPGRIQLLKREALWVTGTDPASA
ncbi:MAG: ThuA domain-containing protein [Thermomicrobiales bacterium]